MTVINRLSFVTMAVYESNTCTIIMAVLKLKSIAQMGGDIR